MQRVSEIRAKRERVFYKQRMAGNKERQRTANAKLVAENEHLLPKIRASERMTEQLEEPLEELLELPAQKQKLAKKVKLRQLVGGGIEHEMDVD